MTERTDDESKKSLSEQEEQLVKDAIEDWQAGEIVRAVASNLDLELTASVDIAKKLVQTKAAHLHFSMQLITNEITRVEESKNVEKKALRLAKLSIALNTLKGKFQKEKSFHDFIYWRSEDHEEKKKLKNLTDSALKEDAVAEDEGEKDQEGEIKKNKRKESVLIS